MRADMVCEYPMLCLREIIANALCHRDYSDPERPTVIRMFNNRIEILSAGAWRGDRRVAGEATSIQQLVSESTQRNMAVAHCLSDLRFVEMEGSGIPNAIKDCETYGAELPIVEFQDGYTVVTIRPSKSFSSPPPSVFFETPPSSAPHDQWRQLTPAPSPPPLQPRLRFDNVERHEAGTFEPHDSAMQAGQREYIRELGSAGPGNYIFAVGRPGVGKSTLQSHLLRYLLTSSGQVVEVDREFARSASDFGKVLAEWQSQWRRGDFPSRTAMGRPTEFRYVIKEKDGSRPMPFGFLEISGEDFDELRRPNNDGQPRLMPSIDIFLNKPHIKVAFLLICNGSDIDGDDFLFTQFLDYLNINVRHEFKKNSSVALILADPVACQLRLSAALSNRDAARPLDPDAFVSMFTPQTVSRLSEWGKRATVASFSVGDVGERDDSHALRRYIEKPNFEDSKLLFRWLSEQFSGSSAGPGFTSKMLNWLNKLRSG